ncbi:unnamed protein product [Symbiodinium necroappetens]|uniref:Uncharacterized protein n=1 Tax=Symbiodinium necroappetens TaxID=1628268 RepID=A0A812NC13_9DINO|nr:unnamed protein product [Symbiodinium necroappetens]
MARALLLALAVMAPPASAEASRELDGELDDVTWTCASLLIAFVVFSGFLACLLHWNNKDIRKEAWAMVNTTISIFCAAGIDFALYRLIRWEFPKTRLVLPEEHGEAPEQSWFFLSLVLGLTCLAPLILHYRLLSIDEVDEDQHQKLFAWSTMGGHICAFLTILYFGHLQEAKAKVHFEGWPFISLPIWVWLLPLLAFVFFVLVMKLIRWLARCCGQDHKHMQAHQAGDALMEACAITVSFLLVQAVCYHMSTECELCRSGDVKCRRECEARRFMPITHGVFGHHIDWCVVWLVLLACGLMLGMGASILWSLRVHRAAKEEAPRASDGSGFLPKCMGQTLPVTAAWCAQRAGVIGLFDGIEDRMNWYLKNYIHHGCDEREHACSTIKMEPEQAANRTQIANALAMSAVALIGLFSVIKLADWIRNKIRFFAPEEDSERDAESGNEEMESKSVAKSVRKAGMAFGMLMGICWEKAFDTSYETMLSARALSILFENTWWQKHFDDEDDKPRQVFSAIVGFLLSLAVIPPWYRYIVPRAMKEKKVHSQEMKLEGRYRPKMPKERTPDHRLGLSDSSDSSESDESDMGSRGLVLAASTPSPGKLPKRSA